MQAISANLFNGDLDAIFALFQQFGVTHVDLTQKDVKADARNAEWLKDLAKRHGIEYYSSAELREYGGNTNHIHEYDMEMARIYVKAMTRLGCQRLIVTPPTMRSKNINHNKIIADLKALANLALLYRVDIALKALPWSPYIGSYEEALAAVKEVNMPNFGMVLDTFNFLNELENVDILDTLPFEKVFVVQCSDFSSSVLYSLEEQIDTDRAKRLIVGDGYYSAYIKEFCQHTRNMGFKGKFSLYANHASYAQLNHEQILQRLKKIELD